MDLNENLDSIKLFQKNEHFDSVTPHKIAVIGFIREFGLLKLESKSLVQCVVAPKYRKDFCLLALKLIQCPDMDFKELENLLTNGKYNLLSVHLQNFCVCLQNIYTNGINALTDCVTSTVEKLMIDQSETNPCIITRTSILGFYLRRVLLHLDKLTFVQLVSLYKSFCAYYEKGRPGLSIRSTSKEKLNMTEQQSVIPPTDEIKSERLPTDKEFVIAEGQWSKKQAELFTAQQANLLQTNEHKAFPPKQMQKYICQIMKDIPEYPDVHFLSFLNHLRVNEFSCSQDALYNCFDRSVFTTSANNATNTERNKHFRYAALNKAALHAHFGHKMPALESVEEALSMCQAAGDSACIAACSAWAACVRGPVEQSPLAPSHHSHASHAALHHHLQAQIRALHGHKPALIFEMVTKGDSMNYLHGMSELTLASLANKSALWALWGKAEMASAESQLLLRWKGAGPWARLAMAATVRTALLRGHAQPHMADALPTYQDTNTRALLLALQAELCLRAEKWVEAEYKIEQLASIDRWESQYLKAEMFYLKGNPDNALSTLSDILDECKDEEDSPYFISLRLKAILLMAQIQQTFDDIYLNSTNVMSLTEASSIAKKYHLHYLAATAEMLMANAQLHMSCAKKALAIIKKVLSTILEHGGAYDAGRALLLYTKCKIATVCKKDNNHKEVLRSCCNTLETAKQNFLKIGASSRVLETWYLQAQLYNEIGDYEARNNCAYIYDQLEGEVTIEQKELVIFMY